MTKELKKLREEESELKEKLNKVKLRITLYQEHFCDHIMKLTFTDWEEHKKEYTCKKFGLLKIVPY